MMETISDDNFATVICGTLDTTAGTLTAARAGHPDLLLIDGDGARARRAARPTGRRRRHLAYASSTHVLGDGATLLAYTDGLIERRREHLDIGLERLRAAALADLPVDALVPHVVDTLVADGDDDVAVLGLRWHRLPPAPAEPAGAGPCTRDLRSPARRHDPVPLDLAEPPCWWRGRLAGSSAKHSERGGSTTPIRSLSC